MQERKIDLSNIFKIRIKNYDKSFYKHEIIKTLLTMKLKEKYRNNMFWIRIYTEHQMDNGVICDLYFENVKTKEARAYEIQKSYTKHWLNIKEKQYSDIEIPYFTFDWIPINLKDCPETIDEISNWLDKYVF